MSKLRVSAIHDPFNNNEALTIDTSGNVGITNALTMSTLTVTNGLSVGSISVGGATITSTGAAEVIYLDGVTSNVQTQLDGKQSTLVAGTDYLTPTGDGSSLTGINTDLASDTTPQLGGDLDLNSNNITGTGNINITGTITYGTLNDGTTALTSTVEELNYLDGVTGITLGSANELLVVGGDGSSIVSDSTLAVDTSNNRLGINQSSPEVTLHMTGEGAQTSQIRMEQYNNSADAPDVRTRRYRGTIASPSAIQSGDYLFRSNHEYYNGSALIVGGQFAFDNTNNANRTQFTVAVTTDGTSVEASSNDDVQFKIDGNDSGAITFNNAYKFPTSDGSANQFLQTNGSGALTFASAINNVVEDTTPQLGGNLDLNSNNITGTGNIDVTGTVTADGLALGDSQTATFGASNDLVIYHDGTDSYIYDDGTGNLKLRTNGVAIQLLDSVGNNMSKFTSGGPSELYYDGSKKLATTSTGVNITGTLTVNGSEVGGGDLLALYGDVTPTSGSGHALLKETHYQDYSGTTQSAELYYWGGTHSFYFDGNTRNATVRIYKNGSQVYSFSGYDQSFSTTISFTQGDRVYLETVSVTQSNSYANIYMKTGSSDDRILFGYYG